MVIRLTRPTSQAHVVPRESNYQKLLPPAIQTGFHTSVIIETRDRSFQWKLVIISVVIVREISWDR